MTASLSHLFVLVGDLQRSRRFYTDVVGLDVLFEEDGYLRLGGGDGFHIGMEQAGVDQHVGGTGIEIAIRVDDVDGTYGRMSAAGVDFDGPPQDQPWGARHAWFTDPDGYRLSIYAPAA